MGRLFALAKDGLHTGVAVILEFRGLRPPYRLDIVSGDSFGRDDPRWRVFEAQLTYILNTGGLMFILTPLPLASVRTGTDGENITMGSCGVRAVRFQYGRWFPVPAGQIEPLFVPPDTDGKRTHWLFRDFPDE
jgi:hypothetical protein